MTTLKLDWTGLTQGAGIIESEEMKLPVAIPEHFGGTGKGANPKQLLTSSAASCYLMTLAAMLQGHKIPASGISLHSELTGTQKSNMKIEHVVEVTLSGDATQPQLVGAQALIKDADKSCMIGNLLKDAGVEITISGNIVIS
ncbi:TPA: OsmC family protein [Raoultella ornithinolytica]|uniref:OsmC family protein n=1 Tax=Enterobacteriaceae TaxID=543 RepID=UPI0013FE1673|nr:MULTISPECIES: OsmC family protein [Enterobacteriaceae]MBN4035433.1 OsmC family protein [Citrobacter freundii]MCW9597051.1 OsmC family protein [Klebsiella michiganensis]MCW9644582.1 OsmC family protein [Klebsiella michiganensis]MEA8878727.1 OsmC family protein [Citrobacter freundii]